MSKRIYAIAKSSFCPLGNNAASFFNSILKKENAFQPFNEEKGSPMVAQLSSKQLDYLKEKYDSKQFNLFEQMCLAVADDAFSELPKRILEEDTVFIISSTKGNIDALNEDNEQDNNLLVSAKRIASYFKNPNEPIVISNACISGSLALLTAKRLLENGKYQHACVIGADCLSEFVLAGFQSFQALSAEPCRPFDLNRKGLNLGEAAACIVLSVESMGVENEVVLSGMATTNDANHLSGPSRTGEELALAITRALKEAQIEASQIDFISAHGTATNYNDEMESRALNLSGANHAPLHSLKSFIGHTLGAAGIIESVVAIMAMEKSCVIPSLGFKESGVSGDVNVVTESGALEINHVLKTASGFGGCNAALIWTKV